MAASRVFVLMLSVSAAVFVSPALAACSGTPASSDAISAFMANPAAWLSNEPRNNLIADIQALGVSASGAAPGAPLAGFTSQVTSLLTGMGPAQAGQAAAIGTGLGTLGASCKAEDPTFNANLSAAVAQSRNVAANDAFQRLDSDIASVGGSGGAGVGGSTGSNSPSGAPNSSNPNTIIQTSQTVPPTGTSTGASGSSGVLGSTGVTTLTTGSNNSAAVVTSSSSQ